MLASTVGSPFDDVDSNYSDLAKITNDDRLKIKKTLETKIEKRK